MVYIGVVQYDAAIQLPQSFYTSTIGGRRKRQSPDEGHEARVNQLIEKVSYYNGQSFDKYTSRSR